MKRIPLIFNLLATFFGLLSVLIFFTGGFQFFPFGIKISLTRWGRPFFLLLLTLALKKGWENREALKANRKKIAFTTLLLFLMCSLFAVVGEIAARQFMPQDPYGPVFQMHSHNWIQFSLVPELKTKIRIDDGSFIQFNVNSQGYRGPEIGEKSEDKFRILCLGDSFLMGKDVDEADTLPSQLEQMLGSEKFQVINAGCGGWNTTQEYYDFKERGIKTSPDCVLLFYVFNDSHYRKKLNPWRRLRESVVMHSALYRFFITRWIRLQANLKPQVQIEIQESKSEEGKKDLEKEPSKTPLISMGDWNQDFQEGQKGWEESKKSLKKLHKLSVENNLPFMVVLYPWLVQLNDSYPFQSVHQALKKFCEEEKIPFLDLLPYYMGQEAVHLWVGKKDSHPNQEGQKIAAEAVLKRLKQSRWLQKKKTQKE